MTVGETKPKIKKIIFFGDYVSVLASIREKLDGLTKTQRKIGEFVLKQPEQAFKMSITELTHKTGTKSESTIVRFYRELGYESYHDFKVTLATEIAGNSFYHTYEDITADDNVGVVKRKIFEGAAKTLHRNLLGLSNELLEQAVQMINAAGRLIIIGYGTSGSLASDAQFRFSRLGIDTFYFPDPHFTAVQLAEPQEGDVIFAISQSGETKGAVIPVEKAKPPAKVIALTGSADSPLGNIADICIATESEEMNYRTDAMIARMVDMAIIGTIFTSVSLLRSPSSLRRLERTRQALSYLKY